MPFNKGPWTVNNTRLRYKSESQLNAPAHLFVARQLRFESSQPDVSELIELVKMPLDEVVKFVMESRITHAPSCVLILKAKNWLNQ